MTFTPLR